MPGLAIRPGLPAPRVALCPADASGQLKRPELGCDPSSSDGGGSGTCPRPPMSRSRRPGRGSRASRSWRWARKKAALLPAPPREPFPGLAAREPGAAFQADAGNSHYSPAPYQAEQPGPSPPDRFCPGCLARPDGSWKRRRFRPPGPPAERAGAPQRCTHRSFPCCWRLIWPFLPAELEGLEPRREGQARGCRKFLSQLARLCSALEPSRPERIPRHLLQRTVSRGGRHISLRLKALRRPGVAVPEPRQTVSRAPGRGRESRRTIPDPLDRGRRAQPDPPDALARAGATASGQVAQGGRSW